MNRHTCCRVNIFFVTTVPPRHARQKKKKPLKIMSIDRDNIVGTFWRAHTAHVFRASPRIIIEKKNVFKPDTHTYEYAYCIIHVRCIIIYYYMHSVVADCATFTDRNRPSSPLGNGIWVRSIPIVLRKLTIDS